MNPIVLIKSSTTNKTIQSQCLLLNIIKIWLININSPIFLKLEPMKTKQKIEFAKKLLEHNRENKDTQKNCAHLVSFCEFLQFP